MGDDAPEGFRLFVAIRIPDQIKAAMAIAQSELRHALPERGVTWTEPEQFHLTLKFLGQVEAQRVPALAQKLGAACHGFSALRLRAERVGAFPSPRSPRVIWAGLADGTGRLAQVQAAVEEASSDFTNEPPGKKFSGHVTLGRVKRLNRRDAQLLAAWLDRTAVRSFGEWTATEVELMRSELSSAGARHTCMGTFPLMAQTTTGRDE